MRYRIFLDTNVLISGIFFELVGLVELVGFV